MKSMPFQKWSKLDLFGVESERPNLVNIGFEPDSQNSQSNDSFEYKNIENNGAYTCQNWQVHLKFLQELFQ